MIVTVGNTKGGTGKTTFAVQIALERQSAGKKPLACVQLADGRLLRAQLAPLAEQHDVTVIDAGGHDSEAFRFAMLRSDLLVVPVQPRAVDAWELEALAAVIDRAQIAREDEGRPPLRVLAALSLADPGDNRDNLDTLAAIRELPQFTVAEAIVRRRKAVANAMAHGLAVRRDAPA